MIGYLCARDMPLKRHVTPPTFFVPLSRSLATTTHAEWILEMATFGLIDYAAASPEVRAIYDDIMATRHTDWINNFWKALAHDPASLKRTWDNLKAIMAPGALDALTKELIYVAVSVTNGCAYCIASHTAAAQKAGMSAEMFAELLAVVSLANATNRLANGYQVDIDDRFRTPAPAVGDNSEPLLEADALGATRHQRHALSRGASGGRETAQPRASASVKRAAASSVLSTATGQPTQRRRRR